MSGAVPRGAERDPGLQPERTRLAWRRTTLSSTVVLALAGRAALAGGGSSVGGVVAGVVCCGCWVGLLAIAHRRIRALARGGVPGELVPRYAAAVAVCVVGLVGGGAGLVLGG
ncbi:DUF202 domain-containing protein [Streptomyces sp. NPDC086080]|uniref:DUF202 domain-containing protein n=1 Tax=Streptomyces sp. NPDC086080 TaxID=3365748 RepID=UPI0037D256DC